MHVVGKDSVHHADFLHPNSSNSWVEVEILRCITFGFLCIALFCLCYIVSFPSFLWAGLVEGSLDSYILWREVDQKSHLTCYHHDHHHIASSFDQQNIS